STLAGGANIPLKIEVVGIERVEVPAGTFDCLKLELSVHQTFWYSIDPHRYLVKFEANSVVVELAAINHLTPNQPVSYQVASHALTLSLPSGWYCDTYPAEEPNGPQKTAILDSEAAS